MSKPSKRVHRTIAIAAIPILAAVVGIWSAHRPMGVLFAMAEPLLFATLMVALVYSLIAHRHRVAASLLVAAVVGTATLQMPNASLQNTSDGPQWLRALRGCALLSKPAEAPIRLVIWTIDEPENIGESIDQLLLLQPDIVVLNGIDDPILGSHLGSALDGEVKFFPSKSATGGVTAVVRGSFQYCGGKDDHWKVDLPSHKPGGGQTVITFPHIKDAGVFPLMLTRFDATTGPGDWLAWGDRVIGSARETAQTAATIGSHKMVLMGDLQIPSRSGPLAMALQPVGLRSVHSEPNWPAHMMNLPMLPQHARDQVWVGRGWHAQSARVVPEGKQSRLPIVFDLVPDNDETP